MSEPYCNHVWTRDDQSSAICVYCHKRASAEVLE